MRVLTNEIAQRNVHNETANQQRKIGAPVSESGIISMMLYCGLIKAFVVEHQREIWISKKQIFYTCTECPRGPKIFYQINNGRIK